MYQFYVVHPRDGEGCSWTLHRNYLLPISPNIGQDEKDAPMAGVESTNTSTPVPPVDSEPTDAGPSGTVTSSVAGSTPQGSLKQPAPLRCGTRKTQNQLLGSTGISVCWQIPVHLGCIGWSMYLSPCLVLSVHHFLAEYSVNTLYLFHHMSAQHHSFWHWGEFLQCSLCGGFLDGGSGPKIIWPKCNCPTRKNPKRETPIETLGVCSSPTQEMRWQT